MRHILALATAAAVLAAGATMAPAQAMPAAQLTKTTPAAGFQQVRWRGHGWHGGWRHRGRGGAGLALGLATGAIIGGALANGVYGPYGPYDDGAYAQQPDDGIAYCMQHFKSYDVRSGSYLGYDGMRHACP